MGETDQQLAERVAGEAGAMLRTLRTQFDTHVDSKELREEGDRRSHELIMAALGAVRSDDTVMSEEGIDDLARLNAERVWIVDPLDGTREYSERLAAGWRDDWAVHVALWRRGTGLQAGAVALPAREQVFGIATRSAVSTVRWGERKIRLAVSRSHPAPIVERIAPLGNFEFVPMGSAGVKAMSVVTGEVDAYVHNGGQFEWDSAAPVVVAAAAGCITTRLDGSALEYNRANPWLPDLVVCAPSISEELAEIIRRALSQGH